MTATCTVCTHRDRAEMERQLASGASQRAIVDQFEGVTRSSLGRHVRSGHVPLLVLANADAEREHHAADLATRVDYLWRRADAILRAAEGRPGIQLAAIRELRATCELLGKLTGQLYPQSDMGPVSIKLQFSNGEPAEPPAWLRPRARVQLPEPGSPS